MENKHFYHAASKGLEDRVLFCSEEQFAAGMNRVAFCSLTVPEVIVIAFVLMDNHVHFILYGTYADCMRFMAQYWKLTKMWTAYNAEQTLDVPWEYDCWKIPNKEKLQEKICYVLRNPMVAGMGVSPTSYFWGSGPLMFSKGIGIWGKPTPVGPMSEYQRRKRFSTKIQIPEHWTATEENLLWPGSYVNYLQAEQAFGSATSFIYMLCRKNEDLINQEMYGNEISLPDSDMLAILSARSESEYGIPDLRLLSVEQRLELCRAEKNQHGANLKQLARLLHIKLQDLGRIM